MERHPNSARFHEILQELGELHDKKQGDYGRGNDPFANVRSSTEWGVKPWVGAMIRANDKVRRLQSLIQNGKLNNESAEDSLRDLAVYSIISLVLFEEDRKSIVTGSYMSSFHNSTFDPTALIAPTADFLKGVRS